jgi:hypothetical protein
LPPLLRVHTAPIDPCGKEHRRARGERRALMAIGAAIIVPAG